MPAPNNDPIFRPRLLTTPDDFGNAYGAWRALERQRREAERQHARHGWRRVWQGVGVGLALAAGIGLLLWRFL